MTFTVISAASEVASDTLFCSVQFTKLLPVTNEWGETALHLSAAAGHARVVQKLVGGGASLDPEDKVCVSIIVHQRHALLVVGAACANNSRGFSFTLLHVHAVGQDTSACR